jgi:Na+-translocating ferredoxin:NAD+ oxidoreductase RnfG subunit
LEFVELDLQWFLESKQGLLIVGISAIVPMMLVCVSVLVHACIRTRQAENQENKAFDSLMSNSDREKTVKTEENSFNKLLTA